MIDLTNGLDMSLKITEGFSFSDFDTTKEGMMLVSRSAPTPSEKSIVDSGPFVQGVYDFSMMMGERVFDNRSISYEFHLLERDYGYRKIDEAYLKNALMKRGIMPLYDTHDPDYYYLGKCVSVNVDDDHVYGRLVISIEFDCYPFMIALKEEGNDDWDSFDFELDYAQENTFYPKRTTFKPLSVGSLATVGAWSTAYDGLEPIPKQFLGASYTITDIQSTTQGVSSTAYYLSGLNKWVIEQDVVQAQDGNIEVNLTNLGSAGVTPTIITDKPITIIKGNGVYNVWPGETHDDDFRLDIGDNKFTLSGYNADVKFEFYKELM